jgi:hypothetical protein
MMEPCARVGKPERFAKKRRPRLFFEPRRRHVRPRVERYDGV